MTREEQIEYWRKQHPLDVNLNELMDFFIAQLKAKDDEIELLKFIVEESIKKPMGVEPHSWSNYKMLKEHQ